MITTTSNIEIGKTYTFNFGHGELEKTVVKVTKSFVYFENPTGKFGITLWNKWCKNLVNIK